MWLAGRDRDTERDRWQASRQTDTEKDRWQASRETETQAETGGRQVERQRHTERQVSK